MSGIPVFSAGTSLQSSGASVSAQISADSAGMLPLFVRVTATAAGYFRLSQDGAPAAVGDLLIQPADGLILKTCGLSQFSFVSQSGASTVTVTPIDVGGIKYPTSIFTPAALFTTGVNGAWYDPSDFSTMFQDAAGTTPVTAVGQPVGLMLDKSNGLVLGPELVTNGDFSNGTTGWVAIGSVISVNAGRLLITNNGALFGYAHQVIATTPGVRYRIEVDITIGTAGTAYINIGTSQGGINVAQFNSTISKKLIATFVATSATTYISPLNANVNNGTNYYDNISVRELPGNHAFNPSGNSANFPVLQRDGTGRYYLACNGVNQWLQTNSIDFTYGDKMFVSAGARKLSDSVQGIICELGNFSSQTGAITVQAPTGAGLSNLSFGTRGTIAQGPPASGYPAPVTVVLSGIGDISKPEATLRVNGATVSTSSSSQGTGNYGNYPLYIGARAGSSLWFNGRLYGLVVAGKAASASEIASTETWLNQKTGAY